MSLDLVENGPRSSQPAKSETCRHNFTETVEAQNPADLSEDVFLELEVRSGLGLVAVVDKVVGVVFQDEEVVLLGEMEELDPPLIACTDAC